VRVSIDVDLDVSPAFDLLVEELTDSLTRRGLSFGAGPNGEVKECGRSVGRVLVWEPGERIVMHWTPAQWSPGDTTEVNVGLEPFGGRTRIVVEHRRWGPLVGSAGEVVGWFADQVAAPMLQATAPQAFGDWLTDRRARRPRGREARAVYGDPLYHFPNFRVILDELALSPRDFLVEVGCGGGALLRQALASGCRAAAVDHSPEMVRLAREANRDAVIDGRLDVQEGSAERLPFPDATFTRAAMTGVLGFLSDPVAVLREIRRVLVPGGRFVGLGSDPELRGTPAAPEPMASRLRFYESAELEQLARDAGFEDVTVVRRSLERYAKEAGVPEEHLALFRGDPGARFLLARKS
jgi:SAM-dependent methyltransferase